jgi:hypothetical protein
MRGDGNGARRGGVCNERERKRGDESDKSDHGD